MITFQNIRLNSQDKGTLFLDSITAKWESIKNKVETFIFKNNPIKSCEWTTIGLNWELKFRFNNKSLSVIRFSGFTLDDEFRIKKYVTEVLEKPFFKNKVCLTGQNWGKIVIKDKEAQFLTENRQKLLFSLSCKNLTKTSVNVNESSLSLEFEQQNIPGIQLGEIRMFIPNNFCINKQETCETISNNLEKKANLSKIEAEAVCILKLIQFRAPRGKFTLIYYNDQLRLKNQDFQTSIPYSHVKKCFVLHQPNGKRTLLISLNPPIRQGQTTYNFIVCEFSEETNKTVKVNATEKELETIYADRSGNRILDQEIIAPTIDILISLFSCLSKTKIVSHGQKSYTSSEGLPCFRCSLKGNIGLLYPLPKSFFFIHKPIIYARFSEIRYVQFNRVGKNHFQKNFDLIVNTVKGPELRFNKINLSELKTFYEYLSTKDKLKIMETGRLKDMLEERNIQDVNRRSNRIYKNTNINRVAVIDYDPDQEEINIEDTDFNIEDEKKNSEEDENEIDEY